VPVFQGDADLLVFLQCEIDTANAIPGAQHMIIEGMGHAISPKPWPQIIEALGRHIF